MTKHLNIRIFGEVQDVNFRSFAHSLARELAITGFVRNEPNGTVYIEAEGREENLKQFLDACRLGPRFARIKKVDFEFAELENFKGFRVLY